MLYAPYSPVVAFAVTPLQSVYPQTTPNRSEYLELSSESLTTHFAAADMQSHSSGFGDGGRGEAFASQLFPTEGHDCRAELVGV